MPKLILDAIMRVGDPFLYKCALEQKDSIEKLAGIKLIAILPDWKEECQQLPSSHHPTAEQTY